MKRYYNRKYFENRNVLSRHLVSTIKNLMQKNNLKKVLDVGCGSGKLVQFLYNEGFNAYGCDNSKIAVYQTRKNNVRGRIFLASASKLPFENNNFDLITSISVIEHLTQKQASNFLKEAKRILKPQGIIFIVTPNFATPLRVIQGKRWFGYSDPTHITFYSPSALKEILKKVDFNNFNLKFKTYYYKNEFPEPFSKLPQFLKRLILYLLFSTNLSFIRNSFWISAQKK